MPNSLKISIITPCLNRVDFIEKAIQSVLNQNYSNVEHIVVDGGSTDGTLDVLKSYPSLKVVTGKDHGMYDALNAGLDLATGDIIGFLNTDDLYAPNIFHESMRHFEEPNVDAVAGHAIFWEKNEEGEWVEKMHLSSSPPEGLYKQIILSGCLMNAWFFRRELCLKSGRFDPKFKISGDADFMIRLRLKDFRYKLIDLPIYHYHSHADSLTMDLTESKLCKILRDSGMLAERFIGKEGIPDEVQSLLVKNYLNIGNLLADIYLEKFLFKEILELARLLERYDPQWMAKYTQAHQEIWPYEKKDTKSVMTIKSFWDCLKRQ